MVQYSTECSQKFHIVYLNILIPNNITHINDVSLEQSGEDYIRPNADLETRPQIRSKVKSIQLVQDCEENETHSCPVIENKCKQEPFTCSVVYTM